MVVTLGEGNSLVEMKLANDALKWRLRQKQRALDSALAVINDLKLRNRELMLSGERGKSTTSSAIVCASLCHSEDTGGSQEQETAI